MKKIVKYNAFDENCERGWVLGHFTKIPELNTQDLEVQFVKLQASSEKNGISKQKKAKTLSLLVSGKMEIYFKDETVRLEKEGDFVIFDKGVDHSWKVLEDSTILSVRWPSLPGDVVRK